MSGAFLLFMAPVQSISFCPLQPGSSSPTMYKNTHRTRSVAKQVRPGPIRLFCASVRYVFLVGPGQARCVSVIILGSINESDWQYRTIPSYQYGMNQKQNKRKQYGQGGLDVNLQQWLNVAQRCRFSYRQQSMCLYKEHPVIKDFRSTRNLDFS